MENSFRIACRAWCARLLAPTKQSTFARKTIAALISRKRARNGDNYIYGRRGRRPLFGKQRKGTEEARSSPLARSATGTSCTSRTEAVWHPCTCLQREMSAAWINPYKRPFPRCSARVFRPWHAEQRVARFAMSSVPPSSSGIMWSTCASLPLVTLEQSLQTYASRTKTDSRRASQSAER